MRGNCTYDRRGFTLIELSIVLVVIGLIVGGILVGQSLISAAGVRATITQVEKFNQATNAFYGKYGALPGDLNAQVASTFGFTPRGLYAGQGDGNGIIESNSNGTANGNNGFTSTTGESNMFWVDLTTANGLNVNLIDGSFSTASPTAIPGSTITNISAYLPAAKLGNGNYFYVWSGITTASMQGTNYFGLSAVSAFPLYDPLISTPGLTVSQAYNIDKKIDDGLPQNGNVTVRYIVGASGYNWAAGGGNAGAVANSAATGSSLTCYDNGGVANTVMTYSIEISNGANVNCALSFRMQAGD